jgi:hypothetical protein
MENSLWERIVTRRWPQEAKRRANRICDTSTSHKLYRGETKEWFALFEDLLARDRLRLFFDGKQKWLRPSVRIFDLTLAPNQEQQVENGSAQRLHRRKRQCRGRFPALERTPFVWSEKTQLDFSAAFRGVSFPPTDPHLPLKQIVVEFGLMVALPKLSMSIFETVATFVVWDANLPTRTEPSKESQIVASFHGKDNLEVTLTRVLIDADSKLCSAALRCMRYCGVQRLNLFI